MRLGFGPYHASARLWAAGALLAVFLPPGVRLGWWLPLHLALAGATSQLIVGGQLQFSSALAMARPASRRAGMIRLGALNAGALMVVIGRVAAIPGVLIAGGVLFAVACLSAAIAVERVWRRSIARRFPLARWFYLGANASILIGATLGAALGGGAFRTADGYLSHRLAHMILNLMGWGGLTILGTVLTLLPTVLHVRMPDLRGARAIPALTFGGLAAIATGLTAGWRPVAGAGALVFAAGVSLFGRLMFGVLRQQRPRATPGAARHLVAGLGWLAVVTLVQIPLLFRGDAPALRDLWVVGLGGGMVMQAVIGSWAFLLPMARRSAPGAKGRELVAFELGVRLQVAAFNAGLALVLLALRGLLPDAAGAAGVTLAWSAAAWALFKGFAFPWLARLSSVRALAAEWWAPREGLAPSKHQTFQPV